MYEYTVEVIGLEFGPTGVTHHTATMATDLLNERAREGWRAVGVAPAGHLQNAYTFERPLKVSARGK